MNGPELAPSARLGTTSTIKLVRRQRTVATTDFPAGRHPRRDIRGSANGPASGPE